VLLAGKLTVPDRVTALPLPESLMALLAKPSVRAPMFTLMPAIGLPLLLSNTTHIGAPGVASITLTFSAC